MWERWRSVWCLGGRGGSPRLPPQRGTLPGRLLAPAMGWVTVPAGWAARGGRQDTCCPTDSGSRALCGPLSRASEQTDSACGRRGVQVSKSSSFSCSLPSGSLCVHPSPVFHDVCPKSGIVSPACSTPTYTQSRDIVFIAYLRRYGC